MASKEVAGVDLKSLEEPIHVALTSYQDRSLDSLVFDLDAAPKLELTPEKPNSARSATVVKHMGEVMGTLYVIAFAPHDGTGDENTYSTHQVLGAPKWLPVEPKVMPRSKAGIHSEIHLPLVGQFVDSPVAQPALFAGNLSLVGINKSWELTSMGELGQGNHRLVNALQSGRAAEPEVRLTTGYDASEGRFGDPHAVYNEYSNVMQVAGFLAITDKMVEKHGSVPGKLEARLPLWPRWVEAPSFCRAV